jgi:phosphatidylglycerol:prolipoprotein diacylglycerol transferase
LEQILYFLAIALGFSIGIYFIFKTADSSYFTFQDLSFLVLPSVPLAWIGARLGHVFFEAPLLYLAHPIRVFYFWEGGFVFLGGVVAVAVWVFFISTWRNLSVFRVGDLVTPWVELAYSVGRLGCFFAGCCFGRVCILPKGQSWFCPQSLYPTQLIASFLALGLFLFLLFLKSQLGKRQPFSPGKILAFWLVGHGINRLIMEHYRGDFRGPLIADLTIGVWFSWALVAFGLSLMLITGSLKKYRLADSSLPTEEMR